MSFSCDELARELGLECLGDGSAQITHFAPIDSAGPGALTFVNDTRFLTHLQDTSASAVIVKAEWADRNPTCSLVSENPYLTYAQAIGLLYPRPTPNPGVHPGAVVAQEVELGDDVSIAALASVGSGSAIGHQVEIQAGARIGRNVTIGERTLIKANVVIEDDTQLGSDCVVQPGAIIGGDGFGFANDAGKWVPIRQIGRVRIGNRVEIGANTTIDRGALDDTIIEDGVILDNQIQIAHNVHIGKDTAIAGCVGIAGSTRIGSGCTIGGASMIVGHLTIADHVHLNAGTLVAGSIAEPGRYASATPLDEVRSWRRNAVRIRQLDAMSRRVRAVEKDLVRLLDNNE